MWKLKWSVLLIQLYYSGVSEHLIHSNPLSSNIEWLPSSRTLSSSASAKVSIQALSGTSLEASGVELQGKIDACGMNPKDPPNHPPTASILIWAPLHPWLLPPGWPFPEWCCAWEKAGKGWERWWNTGRLGHVVSEVSLFSSAAPHTNVTFPCPMY